MNKNIGKPTIVKIAIIGLFVILSVVSILLMGTVKINYNISDYLDESTDTKISLGIMEEEFNLTSDLKVMISGVSTDEAAVIKNRIRAIENVAFVNFDPESRDYYDSESQTALFVVMINGAENSPEIQSAMDAIKSELSDYSGRIEFGGTLEEKELLRNAIQGEIPMILAISLCLVAIIMLITAKSWLEPFVILAAAGVAVLINMGTNAFFGQISYVTNSVAAILQLALSLDYSIMLLHRYRKEKQIYESNDKAMLVAIKNVIKPVSASALTTMAGLLALLFMSFRIGFDIGIVLMKSIVISAITAVTLLPVFLLLFDKLMEKTQKPAVKLKGKFLTNIALKTNKVVLPIALVLIIVCCIFNFQNTFGYTESSNKNAAISDKFGENGTLIVLYENGENLTVKEEILFEKLSEYKKSNGDPVLKGCVSYGSTIGQVFDVDKAAEDFGISRNDAELLFTLYYFTDISSDIKMDVQTFITFALDIILNDSDAKDYVSEDAADTLELLLDLDVILDGEYTSEELVNKLAEINIGDVKLSEFAIMQMYGLYFYDDIAENDKRINFRETFEYLLDSEYALEYLDADTIDIIRTALVTYDKIELVAPNTTLKRQDFYNEVVRILDIIEPDVKHNANDIKFEVAGTNMNLGYIWRYILKKQSNDTITYQDMLTTLTSDKNVRSILESTFADLDAEFTLADIDLIVNKYPEIYNLKNDIDKTLASSYKYEQVLPKAEELFNKLSALVEDFRPIIGDELEIPSFDEIPARDTDIQQLYIMYFNIKGDIIPDGKIPVKEFLSFVIETAETNETIKEQLPEDLNINALLTDADLLDDLLEDMKLYSYQEIYNRVTSFVESIESMDVDVSITETAMMGLYVKYASANNLVDLQPISATDLLNFMLTEAKTNPLLANRISDDMANQLAEAEASIASAQSLLKSKTGNYYRMLLTVDLPVESEDSTAFINYLTTEVKAIFGEGAYVAGEIATTNDLQAAFDADNRFISIFTVVSIFAIILLVFRSVSLPVILVAVIQGAIWISMSMSLLGKPMFFMSYIMTMCILMGATIDYGILLSTNYVNLRKTLDKKDALNEAISSSLPTVFTSGVILMISGFVVGLIASQRSISSVGFLLCRGTLISTLMITLVLPSLLYLLDKFVLKLTLSAKNNEENN